jgi:hypothetical protein
MAQVAAFQSCCCYVILVRRQLESVLAGRNGGCGIQLQPDDGGAHPLAVETVGSGGCCPFVVLAS